MPRICRTTKQHGAFACPRRRGLLGLQRGLASRLGCICCAASAHTRTHTRRKQTSDANVPPSEVAFSKGDKALTVFSKIAKLTALYGMRWSRVAVCPRQSPRTPCTLLLHFVAALCCCTLLPNRSTRSMMQTTILPVGQCNCIFQGLYIHSSPQNTLQNTSYHQKGHPSSEASRWATLKHLHVGM
jgi:hypothetical protein